MRRIIRKHLDEAIADYASAGREFQPGWSGMMSKVVSGGAKDALMRTTANTIGSANAVAERIGLGSLFRRSGPCVDWSFSAWQALDELVISAVRFSDSLPCISDKEYARDLQTSSGGRYGPNPKELVKINVPKLPYVNDFSICKVQGDNEYPSPWKDIIEDSHTNLIQYLESVKDSFGRYNWSAREYNQYAKRVQGLQDDVKGISRKLEGLPGKYKAIKAGKTASAIIMGGIFKREDKANKILDKRDNLYKDESQERQRLQEELDRTCRQLTSELRQYRTMIEPAKKAMDNSRKMLLGAKQEIASAMLTNYFALSCTRGAYSDAIVDIMEGHMLPYISRCNELVGRLENGISGMDGARAGPREKARSNANKISAFLAGENEAYRNMVSDLGYYPLIRDRVEGARKKHAPFTPEQIMGRLAEPQDSRDHLMNILNFKDLVLKSFGSSNLMIKDLVSYLRSNGEISDVVLDRKDFADFERLSREYSALPDTEFMAFYSPMGLSAIATLMVVDNTYSYCVENRDRQARAIGALDKLQESGKGISSKGGSETGVMDFSDLLGLSLELRGRDLESVLRIQQALAEIAPRVSGGTCSYMTDVLPVTGELMRHSSAESRGLVQRLGADAKSGPDNKMGDGYRRYFVTTS